MATERGSARWQPLTREHVQVLHLDNACKMVAELVEYTDDGRLPAVVQNACLESFFVNVRLLSEFLRGKTHEQKDFQIDDLVSGWQVPDGKRGQRLLTWWTVASQHVVHLGNARLANHAEDAVDVSRETLNQMRTDTLTTYAIFRQAYRDQLPEGHRDKHLGLAPS